MTHPTPILFRCLAALLTAVLPAVQAEDPFDVRVLPWFGDNAVLATDQAKADPSSGRDSLLEGDASSRRILRWSTTLEPGLWNDPSRGYASSYTRQGQPWSIEWTDFSRAARQPLREGTPVDLLLGRRLKDRSVVPIMQVTNLVVGSVWVLRVNPKFDSHEMPEIHPATRSRVRILPLDHGFDPSFKCHWLSADEARHSRLFCGMPRVFANALASSPHRSLNGSSIIGLVLCESSSAPPNTERAHSISSWSHDEGEGIHLGLADIADAINQANDSPTSGAAARLEKDRFEGKVTPDLVADKERWTLITVGDNPALPFRTSGVIQ
ncbi:MAG: hypothetical protein IT581_11860 [Verrucomicrobiales bacterium]|nr:hypothetical protein [Verrucomicrobiales bacterium]